jgi:hypothetical protein
MIRHASYDLLRVGLRIAVQLWPLWLFWFAWSLSSNMWLGYLQTFPNRSADVPRSAETYVKVKGVWKFLYRAVGSPSH